MPRSRCSLAPSGHRLLVCVAAVCVAGPAQALEPGAAAGEYLRAAWPSLAHASAVRTLLAARSGHLWIGTSDGLVRFDGQAMVPYDRPRVPGIVGGNIERIFEASDGAFWIGSRADGLTRLLGSAGTSLRERDGLPGGLVRDFAEAPDGSVWVATFGGVVRLPPGTLRPQPASDGLPDPRVDSLAFDAAGTLWAGTRGGLARWEPAARRWRIELGPLPAPVRVHALLAEPDGALWAGTMGAGLLERRGSRWRRHGPAEGLGSSEVSAIFRERSGRLWVATRDGGLAWRDGDRFRRFPWPAAPCDRSIEALAEDREGGLWIGTEACGLLRLQDRVVHTTGRRDGLPSDEALGLAGGADGTVWIGTRGNGLARIGPGHRSAQPLGCGEPCASCWDLAPAPGGALWAVCGENRLQSWDGQRLSRPALPAGLDAAEMVMAARDGALWLARGTRVVRWPRQGEAAAITDQEPLAGKRIPYQGGSGTVWIAADDGVARWRDGTTRLIRWAAHEAPAEAATVLESSDGSLWIGTKGAGVRVVRGERTALIGAAQGLPTDWIIQALEDDAGRLWFSSGKGLFWLERRELEDLADGRRARVRPNVYDGADGVLMRAESFGHPAGWKGPDGRLWFATLGGVAVVDPASLRAPPPRVSLQQLLVDGQPVENTSAPVLGPGPRDVEVLFSALTFAPPETVSFRYRLLGRDAAWVDGGAGRSARFPRLDPGRYRLAVQARLRDGPWGGDGVNLELVVRPPFYRSTWFAVVVVAAVGLLFAAFHRMRLARARAGLQAVMAERSRIARDIHDTLAQAFVATSVRLECLDQALEREDRATMRRHLETARQMVKESLEEARRAVWVLRPQVLERGLPAAFETLVARTSGDPVVTLEVQGSPRPLPPLVEANLLRIAQEGVANAYQHAQARRIVLRLAFAPRLVSVSVTDDGTGLDQARTERGLAGMRERAAAIAGRLSIDGRAGGGTTVLVEVAA